MQLHNLKSNNKKKTTKRVGRGGKRGTYSGHGSKGQKARAGARIRPGFRGGDSPIWKLFPKQRGATKKVEVKHRTFSLSRTKPAVINLNKVNINFKEGEVVSPRSLIQKGLISTNKNKIKVLGEGVLGKKLKFSKLLLSKSVIDKIEKSGSVVEK